MIFPLLCALLGGATAASHWSHGPPPVFDRPTSTGKPLSPHMNEDMFGTNQFWSDFSRDMAKMNSDLSMDLGKMQEGIARDMAKMNSELSANLGKMQEDIARELDEMHQDLSRDMTQFDTEMSALSKTIPKTITGNEYKFTMTLQGYDEKDIVVKAREGVFVIQAVHDNAHKGRSSFFTTIHLPAAVSPVGTWTLTDGVLNIIFPLKEAASKPTSSTEAPLITQTGNNVAQSREELETQHNENKQDANVGLRGDNAAEICTNVNSQWKQ